MGDRRRFSILADVIAKQCCRDARIADVAAGKGHLSLALRQRGFRRIDSWEPYPRLERAAAGLRWRVEPFRAEQARRYDILVAMHPDEATEEVVLGAAWASCQMFLVPCCAKPSRSLWRYGNDWRRWNDHLLHLCHRNHLATVRSSLPITGRNVLIVAHAETGVP